MPHRPRAGASRLLLRSRRGSCLVRVRAEDEAGVVAEAAAVACREDEVVLFDLAVATLAAALDDGLAERSHAPHVVTGELTAAGVGRQGTAGAELAVFNERSAFALAAETVVFERDEHRVGVAVV